MLIFFIIPQIIFSDPIKLNNEGVILTKGGNCEDAIIKFKKAVSEDSKNIKFRENLTSSLITCGKLEEAFKELLKAIELSPENEILHNNLGVLYFNKKDYKNALLEWELVLKLNPNFKPSQENLINTKKLIEAEKKKQVAKNESQFDFELPLDKIFESAKICFKNGEFEKSKELFSEILLKKNNSLQTIYYLGLIYEKLGDKYKSSEFLKKYLLLESFPPSSLETYVIAKNKLEKITGSKFIQIENKIKINANYFFSIGKSFFKNENYENAIIFFENALKLKNNSIPTLYLLARTYYNIKEYDKAALYLNKCIHISEIKNYAEIASESKKILQEISSI